MASVDVMNSFYSDKSVWSCLPSACPPGECAMNTTATDIRCVGKDVQYVHSIYPHPPPHSAHCNVSSVKFVLPQWPLPHAHTVVDMKTPAM